MKDAAAKIAEKYTIGGDWGALKRDHITRDINRAIRRAVKAERERCVKCVDDCKMVGSYAMISIIKAINGGKNGKA